MTDIITAAADKVKIITISEASIYDSLEPNNAHWFTDSELEVLLKDGLNGLSLDYPIRTRSKVVKTKICTIMGYSPPQSFKKTQPRFPCQNFDVYIQKSDNLQIWNEEIDLDRRYVLIRVDDHHRIVSLRVVRGSFIARLDTTGKLTQKYQAKSRSTITSDKLVSPQDTNQFSRLIQGSTIGYMSIDKLYEKLLAITGNTFNDPGSTQERVRGMLLQNIVQKALGENYHNSGQFPDVPSQMLEIKLQTATTIDLGLISPDSTSMLPFDNRIRHCDVRYAIYYGQTDGNQVSINHLILTTGEQFFSFFRRFEGNVTNKKFQISLPSDFFG